MKIETIPRIPRLAWWAFALCVALSFTSSAWGYTAPEHSRIGMRAIWMLRDRGEGYGGNPYAELDTLWRELFQPPDVHIELCRDLDAPSRVTRSTPIDCVAFADLAALAADHSCSPEDLARILDSTRRGVEANNGGDRTDSHWVFRVLRAAQVADLGFTEQGGVPGVIGERGHEARRRIGAELNLQLTVNDPDYLARAQENLTHFQHARGDDTQAFEAWFSAAMGGANAASSYALYHGLALVLAHEYAAECKGQICPNRASRAWRIVLAEAFALHFLQDAFASGHFQGQSRDSERRNGLHDHANSEGVWARPWDGSPRYRAHGDFFMQPVDEDHAARAVARSLEDLGVALVRGSAYQDSLVSLRGAFGRVAPAVFAYNSCAVEASPGLDTDSDPRKVMRVAMDSQRSVATDPRSYWPLLTRAFRSTPRPATEAALALDQHVNARGLALTFGAHATPFWNLSDDANGFQATVEVGPGIDADSVLSPYRDSLTFLQAVGGIEYHSRDGWTALAGFRFRLPYAWGVPVVGWLAWGPTVAVYGLTAPPWAWRRSAEATRFPWPFMNNPFPGRHLFQLTLGREATFLWRIATDPSAQGGTYQGWEFNIPVFSFAFRRSEHYSRWPWDWLVFDFGARFAWTGPHEQFEAGLALSVSTRVRYVPR